MYVNKSTFKVKFLARFDSGKLISFISSLFSVFHTVYIKKTWVRIASYRVSELIGVTELISNLVNTIGTAVATTEGGIDSAIRLSVTKIHEIHNSITSLEIEISIVDECEIPAVTTLTCSLDGVNADVGTISAMTKQINDMNIQMDLMYKSTENMNVNLVTTLTSYDHFSIICM